MIVDIVVLNKYLHSAQNLNKKFVDIHFAEKKENKIKVVYRIQTKLFVVD